MSETPAAECFRRMAARIDHNAPIDPAGKALFGGAAVIIPPDNGGQPVELLILDASSDPAQFWGTILTRINILVQQLEEKRRTGFGQVR